MQAPSRLLHSQRGTIAFTQTELLIVAVAVGLLIAALLPWVAKASPKNRRIQCANHLKQVGLAHKVSSNDSEDRFLINRSTNQGGTLELIGTGQVYRHYLALSNELGGFNTLVCPSDGARKMTTSWSFLSNTNISYFVGGDADEVSPNVLLGGDRNIEARLLRTGSALWLATNNRVWWGNDIHRLAGNVALADGSVQQVDTAGLWVQVQQGLLAKPLTNRLDFP